MDTFEREMAKKQLEILKTINRNLNYIGRKIELLNATMEKFNGIAIMPVSETGEEEPEKDYGEKIADELIEKCF